MEYGLNELLIIEYKHNNMSKNDLCVQLFDNNRYLIDKTLNKFTSSTDIEDLRQDAFIVLMDAVDQYDENREIKFITYLINRLKWHFIREMANSRSIRIPNHFLEKISQYNKFSNEMRLSGKVFTDADAVDFLNLKADELKLIKLYNHQIRSLDIELQDDSETTYGECIQDENIDIENSVIDKIFDEQRVSIWRDIAPMINNDNCMSVLRYHYIDCFTMPQIAKIMGTSHQRISQLENKALSRIRKPSNIEKIRRQYMFCNTHKLLTDSVGKFKRYGSSQVEDMAIKSVTYEEMINQLTDDPAVKKALMRDLEKLEII